MKGLFTLLMLSFCGLAFSQNTVGLISYTPESSEDGYNLVFPHGQGNVYLLDNCGELVNVWEDDTYKPGNDVLLAPSGLLYVLKGLNNLSNLELHAGGGGEKFEVRDWDNNLVFTYTYNDSEKRLHHDMALLPNGNALLIAWERVDSVTAVAMGRDPELIGEGELWPEHIIEVNPFVTDTDTIVWEWHAWDHLVQDFDPSKPNFGVISENPNRINVNYLGSSGGMADWMHANTLDYHPGLDQIMMSVPTFSEIWVIDHSTTTAEAAGSTGGNSGKGGDLLYRWGNPEAYDAGTEEDRTLFYQHDSHWLDLGLEPGDPNYGKIGVFNNRVNVDFSTVNIFTPEYDEVSGEYPLTNGTFGPVDFDFTFVTQPNPSDLYSNILSGMQQLKNGNILVTIGRAGRAIEVTPAGEIVWDYVVPIYTGGPVQQGFEIPYSGNLTWKMERYATDFPGFDGKDLTPDGFIELQPDEIFCNLILSDDEPFSLKTTRVFPNPAQDVLHVENGKGEYQIVDVMGHTIQRGIIIDSDLMDIKIGNLVPGIYFIQTEGGITERFVKE